MCRIEDIKGNMKDIDVFFFDMGSTVLDFHASKKSDIEMEETGLLKVKKYIEKMYYFIDIEKLNLEVFQPWLEYINTSRKEMLQEKRIDEMIYEYFMKRSRPWCGKTGIHGSKRYSPGIPYPGGGE